MFGIINRRKPLVHAQWHVPLLSFSSNTEAFYQALEADLKIREVPDLALERIEFKDGGWLSPNRAYLRLRRRREVLEVCSAAFGTGWWFSLRSATLPRTLYWWEVWLTILGLVGFFGCYWHLFGLMLAGIVMASSLVVLLLVFLRARTWTSLDEFLLFLPVLGALYEGYFRADSYYRQDQALIYSHTVGGLVRAKVVEMCAMGGVDDPQFIDVHTPQQILTRKEMAKYFPAGTDALV
jgi:hypothetical protein